ncbi:unnamed protein product [Acanthocheilonema viteae]|uniref:LicD family protein n=1 Tax=Acanthocheilonema viteae TaxID=6277 RepID=A0A498SIE5_ACAVI|nr:unnamed protein product [Acanthocheilonema viteae]
MQVLSSIVQLSRFLQHKTLFIDPRFISKMQDVYTDLIGDNQLSIGEENLDDILEPNTVMMAFFDHDGLDIVVGPANWTTFVWTLRRSRFISCRKDSAIRFRKTYHQFFSEKPKIPNEIILTLQRFRNWAIERGMIPMLYAGTLLGWYRECGIIPHTHDIDFAIFIEEHYDAFPDDIMNSSFMELSLRFNKRKIFQWIFSSYIIIKIIPGLVVYPVRSNIGKFIYPLINRTCGTDLLGYLMYVPCNALNIIVYEKEKTDKESIDTKRVTTQSTWTL